MFKIEKDIPIPEGRKRGRQSSYPFAKMAAGESFIVEGAEERIAVIRRAAHSFGLRHRKQFIVRLVPGGVRVWCAGDKEAAE